MKFNRRDFFKTTAGVTALTLGLNPFAPPIFKRKLLAAPPVPGKKKLLLIFFRGGIDAVNTAIPRGDPNYSTETRPTLYIANGLKLDGTETGYPIDPAYQNSFLELHPALSPLMELYQAGNLAILHRVGYKGQSQSHFDSQQFYENGTTTDPNLEEGMLYRQAVETLDLPNNPLAALALSSSQVVALKGPMPIPNFSDVKTFKFPGSASKNRKFLGQLPNPGIGRGILGAYGGPKDYASKPYRQLVYQTGLVLSAALERAAVINTDTYVPANGAVYPAGSSFYTKAKQCAQLFKETPVQIMCINQGGYDTHTNQGGYNGSHPELIGEFATVMQALYRDLQDQWDDMIIVTASEFGRTTDENGSGGTDHGSSTALFVAGGGVKGGVYNAQDVASWTSDGGVYSTSNGRYLKYWTDFRAVFAEIFTRHFGDDMNVLNRVIPKYSELAAANPKEYAPLGFL